MELIEEVDENNKLTGRILDRNYVHDNNLYHRHVFAWIMNNKGMLLMQKRARTKKTLPSKWGKTGGHVIFGEMPEQAIKREIVEELGIEENNYNLKFLYILSNHNDNFFTYNYIAILNKNYINENINQDEVSEVKYFAIEELIKYKAENHPDFSISAWDNNTFEREISYLKEEREKLIMQ